MLKSLIRCYNPNTSLSATTQQRISVLIRPILCIVDFDMILRLRKTLYWLHTNHRIRDGYGKRIGHKQCTESMG